MFEQAVFDVHSYDITLNVDPKSKSITGKTIMTAKIVIPTNVIVLDLDTPFTVLRISEPYGFDTAERDLKFERREGIGMTASGSDQASLQCAPRRRMAPEGQPP